MKVFISWSGEKSASQLLAEGLAGWLQDVLPQVKPFYSTEDIKKGQAWFDKIALELETSDFGILCLTPMNLTSPWMLFEAGAIAKKVGKAKVIPLALGMVPTDLKPPLSMFNGAVPTKEDIRRVIASINSELGDSAFEEKKLDRAFEKWWPDLEETVAKANAALKASSRSGAHAEKRSADDVLAELLELVRGLARRDPPVDTSGLLGFGGGPFGAGGGGGANTLGALAGGGVGSGGFGATGGGLIGQGFGGAGSGGVGVGPVSSAAKEGVLARVAREIELREAALRDKARREAMVRALMKRKESDREPKKPK